MTTVYVVTQGSYSDYHIVGIYSTREVAEAAAGAETSYRGKPQIEEFDLDPFAEQLHQGLRRFKVAMDREGKSVVARITVSPNDEALDDLDTDGEVDRVDGVLRLLVWARDDQHAAKIVNEKRAQIVAANQWPEHHGVPWRGFANTPMCICGVSDKSFYRHVG